MRSFEQVEAWLATATDYERMAQPPTQPGAFDLGRMARLCRASGDPQDALATLHVAGTKGKGSVAALAAAWARAPGRRIGLYTSPHLCSLRERIVIDGAPAAAEAWLAAANRVRAAAESLRGESPTFFEITTAMAFVAFWQAGVDLAVIEVGLGGRLDATNVLRPLACAITRIDRDHTALLGDTVDRIAGEKAGIVKAGIPVVCLADPPAAHAVIAARAAELHAPLAALGREIGVEPVGTPDGIQATVTTPGGVHAGLRVPVLGRHQLENLALAVALCDVLPAVGLPLDPAAGRRALAAVRLPGRCDLHRRRGRRPNTLVDGAHTPVSVAALAQVLEGLPRPHVVAFAAMADKDIDGCVQALAGVVDRLVATSTGTPRSAPPGEIAAAARAAGIHRADVVQLAPEALRFARHAATSAGTVAVTGSLYLAGTAYQVLFGVDGRNLPILGAPPDA